MKKILFVTLAILGVSQLFSHAGVTWAFSKLQDSVAESRITVEPSEDPAQEYDWEPKHIAGQRMIR
jgi:hypothetical protein